MTCRWQPSRLAYEHLRGSLTKGNLWLYILTVLEKGAATPKEVKSLVERGYGFSPATITFYSVIYKLGNEKLVRKSSETFRSSYEITSKGREELAKAKRLLAETAEELAD